MIKYVVFLRGVNVGGRIIKMASLRVCLEKAGLKRVVTVLQSGNVVFESDLSETELKRLIETKLSETFGYSARAQVLSLEKLAEIINAYPFGTAGAEQHDYVIFMENSLEKALVTEAYDLTPGEQVAAGRGVVYWQVNKGSTLKTGFAKLLTKTKYRDFNTNRNIKTLRKILTV